MDKAKAEGVLLYFFGDLCKRILKIARGGRRKATKFGILRS